VRLRRLAVNLALAVASTIVFAVLLELGARALGIDAAFFLLPTPTNCLKRDALLSMSFRPHCEGDLSATVVHTNSLGLRGAEPRGGTLRILSAGDSCTWGWRVADDETYPAALEQLLNARADGTSYEVINAGVPGYTSFQGVEYLRERGMRLSPKIVIVGYGFNDVFHAGDVEEQIRQERKLFLVLRADDFLLNRSALYRYARQRAEVKASPERAARVEVAKYRRNLAQMAEIARRDGAHIMLLSFWGWLAPEKDYRRGVIEVAEQLDVPLVTYKGPLIDAVHPTAEGYRKLAAAIADRLAEEGWIRPLDASS
jgi:lysophospholipase L1-like esterase